MNFSFGSPNTNAGSTFGTTTPVKDNKPFSFTSPTQPAAAPTFGGGSFSFGGAKPAGTSPGLFGTSTAQSTPASGFGAAAGKPAFSGFSSPPNQTVGSPGFGQPAAQSQNAGQNLPFGAPAQTQPPAFGAPAQSQASSGMSFGAATPGAFNLSSTTTAPAFGGFSTPASGFAPAQPATGTTSTAPQTTQSSFTFNTAPASTAFGATASFGQTTAVPSFGQTTATPSFGQTTGTPSFGQTTGTPSFGQTTAAPSFGQTTAAPSFGQTTAQPNLAKPGSGFGFGGGITLTPTFGATTTAAPASTAPPAFGSITSPSFGTSSVTIQPVASAGLSFAANTSTPSFGAVTSSAAAASMPSFGGSQTPTGFGFGVKPAASVTPTSQPAAGLQTAATGLNLGTATSVAAAPSFGTSTGISFSSVPATSAVGQTAAPTSQPAVLSIGNPIIPAASLSLPTSTVQPITAVSAAAPTSIASTGISFGKQPNTAPAASTAATGFQLGQKPAATVSFGLTSSASSQPSSVLSTSAPSGITALNAKPTTAATIMPALTTATTTTAAVQPQPISSINFAQLEESINKWTIDLEDQERTFINQATQINAWDRLLIANGEKIVELNEAVQGVKNEQQSLEHELDFVLAQQKELEELLAPMEKQLLQESGDRLRDPEREHMYSLAENLDTQLRQMSEDLKEVIEHLNETNRSQDSSDPIVQIGRILNAHMSSMQWVDNSIAQISNKLDQLKATHDTLRRDNERSFQLTYN